MTFSIMTFSITTLSIMTFDIQHDDTQHDDIQHNDIQSNHAQHNDTQHNAIFCVKWNELSYQGLVAVTASFKFKLTLTIILEQNDAKEKLGRTKVVSDKNISR